MRKKWLKWILVSLAVIFLLIAAFVLLLHTKKGKEIVAAKIQSYLENKLHTKVNLGTLNYRLPDWIELRNLELKDKRDTVLLSGKQVRVDINMLKLLFNDVQIDQITLSGVNVNVYRNYADSNFSYQFLLDAFTSQKKDTATGKKELRISLSRINADELSFKYNDAKEGKYYSAILGTLRASMDELDLTNNQFTLKDWYLKNARFIIIDSSSSASTKNNIDTITKESAAKFQLKGNSVALKDISFHYRKVNEKTVLESTIDTLLLNKPVFDVQEQIITCRRLLLQNSSYSMQVVNDPAAKTTAFTSHSKPWNIRCDSLSLSGNSFQYDNNFIRPTTSGIDYNHLLVKNMMVDAEKVRYANNELSTTLNKSSLQLNKKIELKNAVAIVRLTDSLLSLENATVAINNSRINTKGSFSFPLKSTTTSDSMLRSGIRLRIENSYLAWDDIEKILPGTLAKLPVNTTKGDRINFDGNFNGSVERLSFQNFALYTGNRQFIFRGNGNLISITDPNKLQYSVSIQQLHADNRLLKASLLQKLRSDSIQIPSTLDISGFINGTKNSVATKNIILQSSYGKATINGTVKNFSNRSQLNYNVSLDADRLETGKWIYKDSLLGKLTGTIKLKGSGTDQKKLSANLDLAIRSFTVKSYPYTAVVMHAKYNKGQFETNGTINDKNLVTKLTLAGNINKDELSAKGDVVVNKADLYQLKLSKDSFNISTSFSLDAPSLLPENLNAKLLVDSTVLLVTGKKIIIDSIMFNGERRSDSTLITMGSPFLEATLNGKYYYNQLPKQVNAFIEKNYFNKEDTVTVIPQQATLVATVTSHDFITYIRPDISLEKPVILTASFDNREADTTLKALLNAAAFHYKSTGAEDIIATAWGTSDSLRFQAGASRLVNASQVYLKPLVKASLDNKRWDITASTKDEEEKDFYAVKAAVTLEPDNTTIQLTDELLLNGDAWKVADNNSLNIRKEGFVFNNFIISRQGQSLSINNSTPGTASAIEVKVDSFELASILAFVNKDSLLASGKLDGKLSIEQPIQQVPEIKGELAIQNLNVRRIPIGNARLSSSVSDNHLQLNGDIRGENEVTINGNAGINTGDIDVTVNLQKLNMKSIEAFSGGKIVRTSGNITGHANLNGTIKKPRWNGELNFDDAAFAWADFNSLYRIKQEKIVFNYPTITLDKFEITDTAGNRLTINGNVKNLDNGSFDLDLNIRGRNFIVINTPRKPESIIYGIGIMDANVLIEGNSIQPSIQGNATLEKGSNVYYIIPQKNNYAEERKEVVTFIKADTINNLLKRKIQKDSIISTQFRGIAYNLNLEVKKEAILTVEVDPLTNDELQIQGTAQINAGIGENGEIGLSGIYNLESGYYNMNYQLIKRKFALVKGSTITFSGDPKNAIADITAQYETNASASDLLGNEITGSTSSIGAGYTQKIPFLVILTIKGSLLKPELGFDIKLKEGAAGVNAALTEAIENKLAQIRYDVSAINKQVFGLLIMNRFIGEKSSDFFGGSGFHADAIAKESVSRFLTEAVNQIADELIKGVDIDINLKNYETVDNTINRTDLDVALSKRMLNDRLSVSVGKNFTVEGSDPVTKTQQNENVQYIPDITTTYKLSKDGRYMIRGYRKNQYEAQVDGYFIETGAVFSISMDYNRFRELFQKRKKRNANRARTTETSTVNKQ